jgi:N-acetyl-anhydromuramyl-L-alanine amidase AmpD
MHQLILLLSLLLPSMSLAQTIVSRPLPHHCSAPRTESPSHVMIHYISNALKAPQDPYHLDAIIDIFTTYKLSAHYLIDREGTIYQLVPHNRSAFHAGKGKLPHPPFHENQLNRHSIGIEMMAIGTEKEMRLLGVQAYHLIDSQHIGFTEAQYEALNWLLAELEQQLPNFKRTKQQVIGHDAYAPQRRGDPGILFDWSKLQLLPE